MKAIITTFKKDKPVFYIASYELWGYDLEAMATSAEEAFELLYAEYVKMWEEDGGEPSYTKGEMASNVTIRNYRVGEVYFNDYREYDTDYSFQNKYAFFGGDIK